MTTDWYTPPGQDSVLPANPDDLQRFYLQRIIAAHEGYEMWRDTWCLYDSEFDMLKSVTLKNSSVSALVAIAESLDRDTHGKPPERMAGWIDAGPIVQVFTVVT